MGVNPDYWKRYKLRPNKVLVRFEAESRDKTLEIQREDGTKIDLTLPGVWTKQYGSGATAFSATEQRDSVRDIAQVLAVGPSFYDAGGNFVDQPCAVGDRVWSNHIWGREVPDPDGGDVDDTLRLLVFSDINAIVE